MNFYSTDIFREASAAAYFPEHQLESQWFLLADQHWRIPVVNGTTPITELPFQSKMIDFLESAESFKSGEPDHLDPQAVLQPLEAASVRSLRYLPRACCDVISAEDWLAQPTLAETYEPAPSIRWADFETWDDFLLHIRQRKSKKLMPPTRA